MQFSCRFILVQEHIYMPLSCRRHSCRLHNSLFLHSDVLQDNGKYSCGLLQAETVGSISCNILHKCLSWEIKRDEIPMRETKVTAKLQHSVMIKNRWRWHGTATATRSGSGSGPRRRNSRETATILYAIIHAT